VKQVRSSRAHRGEPAPDPFGERNRPRLTLRTQLLGAAFRFETDSPALLRIVEDAYAGLPPHALSTSPPQLRVRLALLAGSSRAGAHEPPPVQALAADAVLCGAMACSSFTALSVAQRAALVAVSPAMLRFAYHLRYELLEFAVYVLAGRAQGLVPLHAACVGRDGRAILLVGSSGAGKSTLALHSALRGLEFLAEDSVLVAPRSLRATGVANFLHLRPDGLRLITEGRARSAVRRSRMIRRRSGVRKFEVDLRRGPFRLTPAPPRLAAVVFLRREARIRGDPLTRLAPRALAGRLTAMQPYAARQPGWHAFLSKAARLPAFELYRAGHPSQSVDVLESLLGVAERNGRAP